MESVNGLEKTIAEWYKNVPHLPKEFTKWLAENIWWLTIIGVAISVFALFALVPLALVTFGLSAGVVSTYGYGYSVSTGLFGLAWLSVLLSLVALAVTTVLEALAISPLKSKAKKGWTLLFVVALFNALYNVITSLALFNIFGVLTSLLWAAVWGYFLFEVRGYFGHHAPHRAAAKKAAK